MAKNDRSATVRYHVLAKQPYCVRCSAESDLHVHHVHALSDGGPDTEDNCVVLCAGCHSEWHRMEGMLPFDEWKETPSASFLVMLFANERALEYSVAQVREMWAATAFSKAWQITEKMPRPTGERIRTGIEKAKEKGVHVGRPRHDADMERRIRDGLAAGIGILRLAKSLGVGTSVVQRVKAESSAISTD